MEDTDTKLSPVLIVGAGASGLAAARTLTQAGLPVIILEASDRIGGRIYTVEDERFSAPVELGAEFVHGVPPETFQILKIGDIEALEISGTSFTLCNGKLTDRQQVEIWTAVEEFANSGKTDCTFSEFISNHDFVKDKADAATAYVEGFNAADASLISVNSLALANEATDKIEGERQFRLAVPYKNVADTLYDQSVAALCDLRLNAEVISIKWNRGLVVCTLKDGAIVTGRSAIITLPLPLLQNKIIRFEPPLAAKKVSLAKIVMGQVQRISFVFNEPFWEKLEIDGRSLKDLSFITSDKTPFRTWWTLKPRTMPIIVGWNAGAAYLEGMDEPGLTDLALQQLAEMLVVKESLVRRHYKASMYHDWKNDRLFGGAYSYCKSGGIDAPRELSKPLENTLFFAGEATNWEGHIGTVHGAIATGERAAAEVIQALAT